MRRPSLQHTPAEFSVMIDESSSLTADVGNAIAVPPTPSRSGLRGLYIARTKLGMGV